MSGASPSRESTSAYDAERERAHRRREGFGLQRPSGHDQAQWGLALSGGGIRSATFCLGVLQGLARSPGPPDSADGSKAPAAETPLAPIPPAPLLDQFDYLSTVSGGGYIGGFLSSLYVPGRLSGRAAESDDVAARRVSRVLQKDPPGRVHQAAQYDEADPGKTALAWLRDNGRYLAPSGAGDYLYGVALAIRNWCATQYVVGTAICLLIAMMALLRWSLIVCCPAYASYEDSLLQQAIGDNGTWWSTLWWLCLPVLLAGLMPLGLAFWFSYARTRSRTSNRAHPFTKAVFFGLLIGAIFLAIGLTTAPDLQLHSPVNIVGLGAGSIIWAACAWYVISYFFLEDRSVAEHRVLLTRWLTYGLATLLLLAAVAAVDTLSQTVQLNLEEWSARVVASGSGMALIVWIARALVQASSEKESPGWLTRIPTGVLATGAGALLWLLAATGWHLLLHTLIWNSVDLRLLPYDADVAEIWRHAAAAAVICAVLALTVGMFPGFLNLSTLQGLYSARLTRAYLGASNHARFAQGRAAARSVAKPVKNDGLPLADVYRNPNAPMHLINVCVNQTVDPGEQLVQRDRKGKPLVVAGDGFFLDGEHFRFRLAAGTGPRTDVAEPLALGDWMGVSGAALTTGLGRSTSFGMSLLLGFANVRLGRWWISGVPGARNDQGLGGAVRRLFGTQVYLLNEISARFHGTRRLYQYLSDGGHFENTAVYELLRWQRGVRLIVVCDCGCDPDYSFRDLANLMRLARIDHGLELRINEQVAADPLLGKVFGRPSDLRPLAAGADGNDAGRCALLVDVVEPAREDRAERCVARIVLLKPRLIDGIALDVASYSSQRPSFPQEPTGDQFYDEAQWESYRKLGVTIALRVFPQDPGSLYAKAFWRRVLS